LPRAVDRTIRAPPDSHDNPVRVLNIFAGEQPVVRVPGRRPA
jgi:hypothetical protein